MLYVERLYIDIELLRNLKEKQFFLGKITRKQNLNSPNSGRFLVY